MHKSNTAVPSLLTSYMELWHYVQKYKDECNGPVLYSSDSVNSSHSMKLVHCFS